MDLRLSEMVEMQKALQEKYLDKWGGLFPERAKDQLLWSIIETGEAADIIKKRGDEAILNDPQLRHDFIEEVGDVVMYLLDALLCYGVTSEEFAEIYRKKFERNMHRWE